MTVIRNLMLLCLCILLVGCPGSNTHYLTTQLLRPGGPLKVVAESDTRGVLKSVAGTNPHVLISFAEEDTVIIEQSRILVRGKAWGSIPENAAEVQVLFTNKEFTILIDGEGLTGTENVEQIE